MMNHASRTYALVEANLPFQVATIQKDNGFFDLLSKGFDDFDGQLDHAVSAHPKVDRRTGELLAFGYNVTKPSINYSLFDKSRKLKFKTEIPITSVRMVHDFLATENLIIVPDLPLEAVPKEAVMQKRFLFKYEPDRMCRYGVFDRNEPQADKG